MKFFQKIGFDIINRDPYIHILMHKEDFNIIRI